jgi:hypothetical protein
MRKNVFAEMNLLLINQVYRWYSRSTGAVWYQNGSTASVRSTTTSVTRGFIILKVDSYSAG